MVACWLGMELCRVFLLLRRQAAVARVVVTRLLEMAANATVIDLETTPVAAQLLLSIKRNVPQ